MSEVIAIFREEGEVAELAKTYYEIGKIYLSLDEQNLALAAMPEALKVAEQNGLNFLISHIEDEILRLDERKWQEVVEKRARHDRVFEKDTDLMSALAAISEQKSGSPEDNPHKRLISLLRVGQALAAERNLDKLLALVRVETESALEAEQCVVFIYDRDRNELWSKIPTETGEQTEIRFPAHLGLAGYVAKTSEILNIRDARDDPRFNWDIDNKTGNLTRNMLCMPARNRKNEIIGVFQVLNKRDQRPFDKIDEDTLSAIAAYAGVSLENAAMAQEMKISFDSFVKTLSSTIDARDPITAGHSARVAEYAAMLGEEMELSDEEIEVVRYASLLHDIGKIGIREDILKKDGRLTEKEYRHIQRHVDHTHEILKNVRFERHLRTVPDIAAAHHEKVDGSGYHRGLKGGEIPLSGRILAIADVFDAITSMRHYRSRMAFDRALAILRRDSGTHFDPDCVNRFLNLPLARICRILLLDQTGEARQGDGHQHLRRLDQQITLYDYYNCLGKELKSKGEREVIRIFNNLYHPQDGI